MLADFCVAVLVVGDDNFAGICRCDASFAIVLSREIALPVLFVFADVLNAE